jgi:outer membrane protein assembly factor BamD (BamD/ComL family)
MLAISLSSPHALIDYDVLKREVYFMTALCATAQFDAEPNEQSYKDALDAWWQLKSVLRSDPDHPYNKKAASELQRLAKEMQKG